MFDHVVLVFIFLNCITIALERPDIDPNSTVSPQWFWELGGGNRSIFFLTSLPPIKGGAASLLVKESRMKKLPCAELLGNLTTLLKLNRQIIWGKTRCFPKMQPSC